MIWPSCSCLPFLPTILCKPFRSVKLANLPTSKHHCTSVSMFPFWLDCLLPFLLESFKIQFRAYNHLSHFSVSLLWFLMEDHDQQWQSLITSCLPLLYTNCVLVCLGPFLQNCKHPEAGSTPNSHLYSPQLSSTIWELTNIWGLCSK